MSALQAQEQLFRHTSDAASLLKNGEYMARKQADLQHRVDAATADAHHAVILRWGLDSSAAAAQQQS